MANDEVKVLQTTRGISRYQVFWARAGSREIGYATLTPEGVWEATRRNHSVIGCYRTRRGAVTAIFEGWRYCKCSDPEYCGRWM